MTKLGKYEIIKEIGKGGFGVVYQAQDHSLDRLVALKVLHPQLTVDPRFIENFKREARNLAKIYHPNVVKVHEIAELEGRLFIAMQFLPGGSLKDRLKSKVTLPIDEVIKIIKEISEGLGAGHKQNIIHRDVKPGNILFDEEGQAVIADFGVARAVQISSLGTTSQSSGTVGTPYYRPPELWRGIPPPSPATDIYSLACVLFEILTGDVLFKGATPDQVLTRHVLDDAIELIEGGDWCISNGLLAVFSQALAKDPGERYQSMLAFWDAAEPELFLKESPVVPVDAYEDARLEDQDDARPSPDPQVKSVDPLEDTSPGSVPGQKPPTADQETKISKQEKRKLGIKPVYFSLVAVIVLVGTMLIVSLQNSSDHVLTSPSATNSFTQQVRLTQFQNASATHLFSSKETDPALTRTVTPTSIERSVGVTSGHTHTPTSTASATQTNTAIPMTRTLAPALTATNPPSPTNTRTHTPLPPVNTRTNTPPPPPTSTRTHTPPPPTSTRTNTPPPPPTSTRTNTPPPPPTSTHTPTITPEARPPTPTPP